MTAKVDHWNLRYAGKETHATKVIYTNGHEDPWRGASLLPGESENPESIYIDIICDDCAHCVDLGQVKETDAPELTAARAQITEQFKQWLALEQSAIRAGIPKDERESYTS